MILHISKKGKALLRNTLLSFAVVKAVSSDSELKLYSKDGLKVKWGNKTLTLRIGKF